MARVYTQNTDVALKHCDDCGRVIRVFEFFYRAVRPRSDENQPKVMFNQCNDCRLDAYTVAEALKNA